MLSKILLSGLLMTSSFCVLSTAHAMETTTTATEEENHTLAISFQKLKEGYEKGNVHAEDDADSYLTVKSLTVPRFTEVDPRRTFTATSSNDTFHILEMKESRWGTKHNHQTGKDEIDYTRHIPGYPILNLEVTRHPMLEFNFDITEERVSLISAQVCRIIDCPIIKTNQGKFSVVVSGFYQSYGEPLALQSCDPLTYTQSTLTPRYHKKRDPITGNKILPKEFDYNRPKEFDPLKDHPVENFRLTLTKVED